jgi:hypothetical protein
MIGLFIALGFIALGIFLCFYETYDFAGMCFIIFSLIFLMIHVPCWLAKGHRYERHLVERNSFIESLNNARLNDNKYELAAISKDIFQYNKDLAVLQYENKGLLDPYIDERIMNLKPIK